MFSNIDMLIYRRLFATAEGYFNYDYASPGIESGCIRYFELAHTPVMNMQFFKPEGSPFTIERNFRILRFYKSD